MKRLIHVIKYRGVTTGIDVFTPFIVDAWRGNAMMRDACVVIPIPLHATRLRERGFNQAELIAKMLTDFLEYTLVSDGLIRTKNTPPQSGLSKNDRMNNVADVFECRSPDMIAGADILLVDDVYTTGATLKDAARVLKSAGARSVSALTLAHGE